MNTVIMKGTPPSKDRPRLRDMHTGQIAITAEGKLWLYGETGHCLRLQDGAMVYANGYAADGVVLDRILDKNEYFEFHVG